MKMFDNEYHAKKQFDDTKNTINKNMPDWGNKNVFTGVYETKIHKSYEMGKKQDKVVNLIGNQFVSNKFDNRAEDEKILRVVQAANEQKEKEQ